MNTRRPLAWAPPAALAGIAIITLAGLLVPRIAAVDYDDGFAGPALIAALTIVSLAGIAQSRLWVLPTIIAGRAQGGRPAPATIEERESSGIILACVFSVSNGVYGLVAAILLDTAWWALPFGALGLISMAVTVPYVRARMDALYRERATAGDP